jgi:membrane protease YdiL (CAAX protease family)
MTVPVSPPGVRPPFLQRLSPVAFALAALLLIFFLYQLVGGVITLVLAHGRFTPENVDLVRWATGIGEIAFILLPTLWLTRKRYGTLREPLRVHIPEVKELAVTMVAVFALQQILQTYMVLQDSIPVPGGVQKIVNEMKDMMDETYRLLATAHTPAEFLSVVLIVALIPAVSEEMLFRGLVQRSFEDAWGGIRGVSPEPFRHRPPRGPRSLFWIYRLSVREYHRRCFGPLLQQLCGLRGCVPCA